VAKKKPVKKPVVQTDPLDGARGVLLGATIGALLMALVWWSLT